MVSDFATSNIFGEQMSLSEDHQMVRVSRSKEKQRIGSAPGSFHRASADCIVHTSCKRYRDTLMLFLSHSFNGMILTLRRNVPFLIVQRPGCMASYLTA
jgi:hypothetical protein